MSGQPEEQIVLHCMDKSRCKWSVKTNKEDPHHHKKLEVRPKICDSVLQCIGNTPLIKLQRWPKRHGLKCDVLVKCEYFNAGGSVKDRIALRMIEEAEREGRIKPGDTLIEPTSGNTGIGIALAAAVKGYRCIIVMPEKMSAEKANILHLLGAEIVRTPTTAKFDSPESHLCVAEKLAKQLKNAHILDQYRNPGNPLAHYDGTAEEILQQCQDQLDMVVLGVGTGGTATGIGRKIRERAPNCTIIGVDPHGSILADPEKTIKTDSSAGNKLIDYYEVEGIGYDFVPTVFDHSVVDKWIKTADRESFQCARELIHDEGILCGGSSGSALFAAINTAKHLKEGQRCVILLPDSVRNYMSKFISDDWMLQRGYLTTTETNLLTSSSEVNAAENSRMNWYTSMKVADLTLPTALKTITGDTNLGEAIRMMKSGGFDQLPIVDADNGNLLGMVTVQDAMRRMFGGHVSVETKVSKCLVKEFPTVSASDPVEKLVALLKFAHYVVVCETADNGNQRLSGIVTHVDLLNYSILADTYGQQ